ncbi:F-box domain-containing protein [Mycena chlorophos]|uniref:F-box domain-containing protein n=1 Tax=Mycena chlorophos TaxID=658473 RepID=A0A8H6TA73_MYCCL|nr:F-box domain-containing protein [Mycena chlorophos]
MHPFPFLELPRDLGLAILDLLSEDDILDLCQVNTTLRALSISVLLTRHHMNDASLELKQSFKVSYAALRTLQACYPTRISALRQLEVEFATCPWDDRRKAWKALAALARYVPPIEAVSLSLATPEAPASVKSFIPEAVLALLRAPTRPVIIIQHLYATIVRPKRSSILERAWNSVHPRANGNENPVDEDQLLQKLQFALAASSSLLHQRLSGIYVRSFLEPSAALGACLIVNPPHVLYLKVSTEEITPAEWNYLLPRLTLPCLRNLCVEIDLHDSVLAPFLQRHSKIERLDLSGDWIDVGSPPTSTLANLSYFSGSCSVIAHALKTPEALPSLHTVGIGHGPSDINDAGSFHAVLEALSEPSCASITSLIIHLDTIDASCAPWKDPDAAATIPRMELRHIRDLRVSGWRSDIVGTHAGFAGWLAATFPGLAKITMARKYDAAMKPLDTDELFAQIRTACPRVRVVPERYL